MGNIPPQSASSQTLPASLPVVSSETSPTPTDLANISYLRRKGLACDNDTDYCTITNKTGFSIGGTSYNTTTTSLLISGVAGDIKNSPDGGTTSPKMIVLDNFVSTKAVKIGNEWVISSHNPTGTSGQSNLCFTNVGSGGLNETSAKKTMCLSSGINPVVVYQGSNGVMPYFYLQSDGTAGVKTV